MTTASATTTSLSHPLGDRSRKTILACAVAGLLLASLTAGGMPAALFGCVQLDRSTETTVVHDETLTDADEIQNAVSAPTRAAAEAIILPFSLIADLTSSVTAWFASEEGQLADLLESGDELDRQEGLHALSLIGSDEAERLLVYHLYADNSVRCRREAALGLRRIRASSEAATLVLTRRAEGQEFDATVQATCAYALSRAGTRAEALATLRTVYRNNGISEVIRAQAMLALAERGIQEIRPDCERILDNPANHPLWHGNALLALAHLGGPRSREYLIRGLSHMDDRAVSGAITGLGIYGDFNVLLTLCREGTLFQRTHALIALGEYGRETYVPVLARYRRRISAANDPLGFPSLTRDNAGRPVTNPDAVIGVYATYALAAAGYRPVVPHLIDLLHPVRHEPWVRLWALHWLIELTGQSFALEMQPWRDWWDEEGDRFVTEGRSR